MHPAIAIAFIRLQGRVHPEAAVAASGVVTTAFCASTTPGTLGESSTIVAVAASRDITGVSCESFWWPPVRPTVTNCIV